MHILNPNWVVHSVPYCLQKQDIRGARVLGKDFMETLSSEPSTMGRMTRLKAGIWDRGYKTGNASERKLGKKRCYVVLPFVRLNHPEPEVWFISPLQRTLQVETRIVDEASPGIKSREDLGCSVSGQVSLDVFQALTREHDGVPSALWSCYLIRIC